LCGSLGLGIRLGARVGWFLSRMFRFDRPPNTPYRGSLNGEVRYWPRLQARKSADDRTSAPGPRGSMGEAVRFTKTPRYSRPVPGDRGVGKGHRYPPLSISQRLSKSAMRVLQIAVTPATALHLTKKDWLATVVDISKPWTHTGMRLKISSSRLRPCWAVEWVSRRWLCGGYVVASR